MLTRINIKKLKKILLLLLLSLGFLSTSVDASVADSFINGNLPMHGSTGSGDSTNVGNNDKLNAIGTGTGFIGVVSGGQEGIVNTLIRIARDMKNFFYAVATIFFLIIALRLIFSSNTEEEVGKFKKGIIWITVGLIVMQLAFAFTDIIFDTGADSTVGSKLINGIVLPMISLLQTLASIFFIAMAIYAFYRLVTANGNDEAVKSGKMTIVYALIGFIIIRFAKEIVVAFYGQLDCDGRASSIVAPADAKCVNIAELNGGVQMIISFIQWLNGFVAIVVLIMIMYAGMQILLSGGDEEKVKKGKNAILYIAIGLLVLVANWLILTFFLVPGGAAAI